MVKQEKRKHEPDQDETKPVRLDALIQRQVLQVLGEPAGLLQVQVKGLWANCYRINVFVGSEAVRKRCDS